jgi:hypothetical protein
LPERIRGAGTLYLWLRRGRTALRVARKLTAAGREHGADFVQGFLLGKPAPVVRS